MLKNFNLKRIAAKSLLRIFVQKLLNTFVKFWIINKHHRPWEKHWVLEDQLVYNFWVKAGRKGVLLEVRFVHHDAKRPANGGQLSAIMFQLFWRDESEFFFRLGWVRRFSLKKIIWGDQGHVEGSGVNDE